MGFRNIQEKLVKIYCQNRHALKLLFQKLFHPIVRRLDDRVTDMKMMVRETSFCQLSSTSGLSIIDVLELKKVGNKSDIYMSKCQVPS